MKLMLYMGSRHYDWADIAKGIAIILMVLGHSSLPAVIQNWIYSFHMPFFFFISGVLTKSVNSVTEKNQVVVYLIELS